MDTLKPELNNNFYCLFFRLMIVIVLQNMLTFSVNVTDNIMLGSYSQTALAGAAAVNQIQFLLQQLTLGLSEGLITLSSRFWGQQQSRPIYRLTVTALGIGLALGLVLTGLTSLFPIRAMHLFTTDNAIVNVGARYLSIMRFTYLPFIVSSILLACLRSMEKVKIGFYTACISLALNISLNYVFIFGRFGAPELGAAGAAVGTLAARVLELAIVLLYIRKKHPGLLKFHVHLPSRELLRNYTRTSFPIVLTQTLFGLSVSLQTAILGHLSSDALAANSAATTIFQYLKLIAVGSSSATVILIGKIVGSGLHDRLNECKKKLQLIYLVVGFIICLLLNLIKTPLVSMYALNPGTKLLALQIITLLSITSMGTAYQMPVNTGIIRGSGDTVFALKLDLISIWGIVYPLTLTAAFVLKLPVIVVVACLNSDQLFKCIPAFLKVNRNFKIRPLSEHDNIIAKR